MPHQLITRNCRRHVRAGERSGQLRRLFARLDEAILNSRLQIDDTDAADYMGGEEVDNEFTGALANIKRELSGLRLDLSDIPKAADYVERIAAGFFTDSGVHGSVSIMRMRDY